MSENKAPKSFFIDFENNILDVDGIPLKDIPEMILSFTQEKGWTFKYVTIGTGVNSPRLRILEFEYGHIRFKGSENQKQKNHSKVANGISFEEWAKLRYAIDNEFRMQISNANSATKRDSANRIKQIIKSQFG